MSQLGFIREPKGSPKSSAELAEGRAVRAAFTQEYGPSKELTAALANTKAIRKAEQRVLAIADAMHSEQEGGSEVLVSHSLDVLFDAVTDLKSLGWEPES